MALITRHCPHLKGKKSKKKTLKVTWDDSGGNDSEQNSSETANFCLIAKDDEVSSLNDDSDYDNSPSYEGLQDVRTLFEFTSILDSNLIKDTREI
ncbi:hypothetical protein L3X38_042714 [Prunus dulcis]|uniref:Uncharacterized protein n=1 Tax=Prunus dulcis TaxID=3755 RepID=A0AAD4YM85_PRUDU|nr:hypothetical protein L3X38_042714 [Prunus dulcis]